MTATAFDPSVIGPAWNAFRGALPIRMGSIRNATEYKRAVAFMNSLLDTVGDDEEHPLTDLLDMVGRLVEDYDNAHHSVPQAPPSEVLRFLLQQHDLKQTDLAKELGSQSVVSEILSGKRAINARQAKALAARFGVSALVFL